MQEVYEMNTGLPDTTGGEAQERYELLRRQTDRIVDRLKPFGIDLRDHEADMSAVGQVSLGVGEVPVFKASRFLPVVAARDRRGIANGLTFWLELLGGNHIRYAVFTSGRRVPWGGDLRGRMTELKKQVRRWLKAAAKKYGVEVLFIGVEYTVSPAGIHLHANVLYRLLNRLTKREWEAFLEWTGAFYPHEWNESGELKNVAEIVKYMVKPDSLERRYVSDKRLLWLYEQTIHARYMTPMGSFKTWWSVFDRNHKALWVGQSEVGDDGRRVVRSSLARVEKATREKGNRLPPSPQVVDEFGNVIAGQPPRVKAENVILARIAPLAMFDKYKEPVTLVAGLTMNPATEKGRRGLEQLYRQIIEATEWAAENKFRVRLAAEPPAPEAPIRVHNSRLKRTESNDKATNNQVKKLPILVVDGTRIVHSVTGKVLYDAKAADPSFFDWIDRRQARREGRMTDAERAKAINDMFVRRAMEGEGCEIEWREQIRRFDEAHRPLPPPPPPLSQDEIAQREAEKAAEHAAREEKWEREFREEQARLLPQFWPLFVAMTAKYDKQALIQAADVKVAA